MLLQLRKLARMYTLEQAISVIAGVNEDAFYKPPSVQMLKTLERHTPTIDHKEAPLPSTALGSAMGRGEGSSLTAANLASSTSTGASLGSSSAQTPLDTRSPLGLLSSTAAGLDPLPASTTTTSATGKGSQTPLGKQNDRWSDRRSST
jgi:hypothetical protein